MEKIRVLIADDQEIIRQGLALIIAQQQDMQVVGQATDGDEAVQLAQMLLPHVVLMDIKMPRVSGIQATREICRLLPNVRVLVLTTYDVDNWVFEGIRAGAQGYLLKDTGSDELVEGIRKVHQGESLLDSVIAGKVVNEFRRMSEMGNPTSSTTTTTTPLPRASAPTEAQPTQPTFEKLTKREEEILDLMAEGMDNRDIAAKLFLSEGTVRNYVSAIMSKLYANNRTQAVVTATRHNMLKR